MSLVVEDGSGLATAESYISVANATAYFAAFGGTDAWLALDDQEVSLRRATRDLDLLYGDSYLSSRLTSIQSLLFPRVTFIDNSGRTVTGLPAVVGQAVAELALINAVTDTTGAPEQSGNIKKILLKADTLTKDTEYFTPTSTTSATRRKVSLLLAPFLDGAASGLYARVVRG